MVIRRCVPHPVAYLLAAVFGIPVMILVVMGFGRHVSQFGFLPALFFGSCCLVVFLDKRFAAGRVRATLLFIAAGVFAAWWIGWQVRLFHCRGIEERVAPVIRALDAHKAATGAYPATLEEIPEARRLGPAIRQGKFLKDDGATISTDGLDTAEATFYLSPTNYGCIIPIEKPFFVSITGFHVYEYLSGTPHWEKDYIVWTVMAL
jgi:hypothetical protein